MNREKAKEQLEDLALIVRNEQVKTMLALKKSKYEEAQECYRHWRAELEGAQATMVALEIYSDRDLERICKHALKSEITDGGIFRNWSDKKYVAWKCLLCPVIHSLPMFFYYFLGLGIGGLIYVAWK